MGFVADNQINLLMLTYQYIHNNARSKICRLVNSPYFSDCPRGHHWYLSPSHPIPHTLFALSLPATQLVKNVPSGMIQTFSLKRLTLPACPVPAVRQDHRVQRPQQQQQSSLLLLQWHKNCPLSRTSPDPLLKAFLPWNLKFLDPQHLNKKHSAGGLLGVML